MLVSSLTRGRFCGLQLMLVLSSAFIPWSKSSSTDDHILASQTEDCANFAGQIPYLDPRKQGDPAQQAAHGSFSPVPTTLVARMDVFEPASRRGMNEVDAEI
jgi:hypothetical protein